MFVGTADDDKLTGTPLADHLQGLAANDIHEGLAGGDILDGGPGFDRVSYTLATSGVFANLTTGVGSLGDALGDTFLGIEGFVGSDFSDQLLGDANDNAMNGRAGADALQGFAGRDRFLGGSGGDWIDGGDGIDTARYDDARSGVTIDLLSGLGFGGTAEGDVLVSIENVAGSHFDDVITGDAQDNRLKGRDGDDHLVGGNGNDKLIGGRGADTLDGGDGTDLVSYEDASEGAIVNLRTPQMLKAAQGDVILNVENFRGSQFNDSFVVGDGDNRIMGGDGDDFIDGGRGDDYIIGGAGSDFMHGSDGIDTVGYRRSDAAVVIDMQNQRYSGGHAEGDTLSWIHNVDGSEFGDDLTGDLLDNRLRGRDGDDLLAGRAGLDVLVGGAGADTFAFVTLSDSVSQKSGSAKISTYDGATFDLIKDFARGTDKLQFDATEFSGQVFATDQLADLSLNASNASAFALAGEDLYYARYASVTDFTNGIVEVTHLAHLAGVTELSDSDFVFA